MFCKNGRKKCNIHGSKAEEIRLRYLYRDLVLRRKVRLPFEAAVKLIGPDCAYHLYSVLDFKEKISTQKAQTYH